MNCTRAKSEIALWSGGDLDERGTAQLERHVAVCPDCREYRQRMSASLQALHNPAEKAPGNLHDSVWPDVESRLSLQSRREFQRAERLNRWLPAAAVAAACLAVIALTSEPERSSLDMFGETLPANLPVGEILAPPDAFVGAEGDLPAVDERPLNPMSLRPSWQLGRQNDYDRQMANGLLHYAGQRNFRSDSP